MRLIRTSHTAAGRHDVAMISLNPRKPIERRRSSRLTLPASSRVTTPLEALNRKEDEFCLPIGGKTDLPKCL